MKVLAHRGLWREPRETNTATALKNALTNGFGVETDLRDRQGTLVIAHDPADAAAATADDFFSRYRGMGSGLPLALNIKADGLCSMLRPLLERYAVSNYFCFDMSVPETRAYAREGFRFFTRQSEYEADPALYTQAQGVWMDMFETDWIAPADVERHLVESKAVALVSPELHGRPHILWWERLRSSHVVADPNVMLCTDHPEEAQKFFND